jgi:hypothetical protein
MKNFFVTLLIGIIAGTIDVLPMLKMKLDKYSISSAFLFYLFLPFIILNVNLYGLIWWLKGGLIAILLAAPIIIIVAKSDKKSLVPMTITSIILGTLIGVAGHLFIV